jgi:hypothetical protein
VEGSFVVDSEELILGEYVFEDDVGGSVVNELVGSASSVVVL